MAPILPLILGVLMAFATTVSAGQQSRHLLPPAQISPAPPGFTSTTLRFDVEWPVACPCTLTVVNGVPGSGPQSNTRVAAGFVWVDGTLVLTPKQISSGQATAGGSLDLAPGTHEVRIEVVGHSTSFITIEVAGTTIVTGVDSADRRIRDWQDNRVLIGTCQKRRTS